jgi:predicted acetyltransferase
MGIEVTGIEPDQLETYARAIGAAFGEHARPEDLEQIRKVAEVDRILAVFDGGELVGGTAAASFKLTVPGGELPVAGVTAVGVKPTHRRRGINTALMRRQLEDIRDRGEALAILIASEGGIYGRYGYGLASLRVSIEADAHRSLYVRGYRPRGGVRLLERAQALEAFPPIYERVRLSTPGLLARNDIWWDDRVYDPEHERKDETEYFFALHEDNDGAPDAYAFYRLKHDWPGDVPASSVNVEELVATDPQAYADMWRYLFDMDLISTVKAWNRPSDEPLLHLLAEPRRLRMQLRDGIYARVLDVRSALSARRYAVAGSLVLEVRDRFCPWAGGRFELEGGPDGAECRTTDAEPDLVMNATDLGAVFLGGVGLRELHRGGHVGEERTGSMALADLMFGWSPKPWCAQMF